MPKLSVVERDYPHVGGAVARRSGRCSRSSARQVKGASWIADEEVAELRAKNGAVRGGVADGRPSLERVEHACEAILALSGTLQRAAWRSRGSARWRHAPACKLADLAGSA